MSNKTSQLEYIRKLLLNYGEVSRNHCLEQRITRLGSRIYDLRQEGFLIEPKRVKKNGGVDYVYYLVSAPYQKMKYVTPDGLEIIRFEKQKVVQ